MSNFDRITQQPGVMGGKACIRGLRVTVAMILSQMASGHSIEAILAEYPCLEREDILHALQYAARLAEESEIESNISEEEQNRITLEAHTSFLRSDLKISDVFGKLEN